MSGKGSNRRREDSAKVEANWPSEWNAREALHAAHWPAAPDVSPEEIQASLERAFNACVARGYNFATVDWSPRETERQQDQAFVEQQRAENLRRTDLTITVDVIDGPSEIRQRLDMRAAILSGEGLGVLEYASETDEEARQRVFRERVNCAIVICWCAFAAIAIVGAHALVVAHG